MNDRGLSLNSTEILKGYLFSQIGSGDQKNKLNEIWMERIAEIKRISKDADLEFFKSWLRAKYAKTGTLSGEKEDFEGIDQFHRWIKNNNKKVGLNSKDDYIKFIKEKFGHYSNLYIRLNDYSKNFHPEYEYIYYISFNKFIGSLYYPLLLAPIKMTDKPNDITQKIALVSRYIENFVVRKRVNGESVGLTTIRTQIYNLILEIRDKTKEELSKSLKEKVEVLPSFEKMSVLKLGKQNKDFIRFLLARITNYIERESRLPSRFGDYLGPTNAKPFEIEHIWPDKFEDHKDEFNDRVDFDRYRNMIGALILIQKGTNQSFLADSFEDKQKFYYGQNLLAKSLCSECYEKNPEFKKFKQNSGLPFEPHSRFKKQDIEKRQKLYQKICEKIWDTSGFD